MEAARTLTDGQGRRAPASRREVEHVSADDWFIGETFKFVQYATAAGHTKTIGRACRSDGKTASSRRPNLING